MEVLKIYYEKDEITKKGKTSEVCFKCSACSKYCPITMHVDRYNIENSFIVHLFTSGEPEVWKQRAKDAWMCCACEKCVTLCPQDRDPTVVFNNLKEKSYQDGSAPDTVYGLVKLLLKTGCVFPINPMINKKRVQLGLPEMKEDPKVGQELASIAKLAGLKQKGE